MGWKTRNTLVLAAVSALMLVESASAYADRGMGDGGGLSGYSGQVMLASQDMGYHNFSRDGGDGNALFGSSSVQSPITFAANNTEIEQVEINTEYEMLVNGYPCPANKDFEVYVTASSSCSADESAGSFFSGFKVGATKVGTDKWVAKMWVVTNGRWMEAVDANDIAFDDDLRATTPEECRTVVAQKLCRYRP